MKPDTPPENDPTPAPKTARPSRRRNPEHTRGLALANREPRTWSRGHLKVESVLRPEDRDAYYAYLRQPGATRNGAHRWLRERGYDIGTQAVSRHMHKFTRRLEAVQQAAEMSYACAQLARQAPDSSLADGAVTRFETLLSQALFDMEEGGQVDRGQWDTLGKALTNAVSNRARIEELRRSFDAAKRAAADAAEAAAKEGGDATTVVDRVKAILGV